MLQTPQSSVTFKSIFTPRVNLTFRVKSQHVRCLFWRRWYISNFKRRWRLSVADMMETNQTLCCFLCTFNNHSIILQIKFIIILMPDSWSPLPHYTIHVSLTAEEPGKTLPQSSIAAGKDYLACKKPHAARRRGEAAAAFSWQQESINAQMQILMTSKCFLAFKN